MDVPAVFSWKQRSIVAPAPPGDICRARTGTRIALWTKDGGGLQVWTAGSKAPITRTLESGLSSSDPLNFSPDGKLLAARRYVFDSSTLRLVLRVDALNDQIAGFTADSRYIVSYRWLIDFPQPTYHPVTLEAVLEETCAKVSAP